MKKITQVAITDSYKPINVSYIKVGDTLEFDCYVQRFKDFVIIISAGTLISEQDVKLLKNTDSHYVKSTEHEKYLKLVARDEDELIVENVVIDCDEIASGYFEQKDNVEENAKVIYFSIAEVMKKFFDAGADINQECIDELIRAYILSLKKDASVFHATLDILCRKNRHEFHCTNVMVLSLGLANHLQYSILQMKLLGKAALLHDIGKRDIDSTLYEKRGKLRSSEYEYIKTHSFSSYSMAQEMKINDTSILDAILHHHEYLDGTGYPDGLKGQRISNFTQIITVCDIFDAMTSERSFHDKKNAFETLKVMKKEYKEKLSSKYIEHLIKLFSKTYS
ncbi:HD domain-containing protein [bacterium]|nr:HD domain-containing protein [bacterium]MBU1991037.1 HD domain-containing protein [bacterium]